MLVAGVETKQDAMMGMLTQKMNDSRNWRRALQHKTIEEICPGKTRVPVGGLLENDDIQGMPSSAEGGALCKGVCRPPSESEGKLDTLAAKGRACEGEPRQAYDTDKEPIRISPVNPTPAYDIN